MMQADVVLAALAILILAASVPLLARRLALSRAKHPSLRGHARIARWVAARIPGYTFDDAEFFAVDGAPPAVAECRRRGFVALAALYRARFAQTAAATRDLLPAVPDLEFTSCYRVPFPFSAVVRRDLGAGAFVQASSGVEIEDLDRNRFYDLAGSYGVNLLGHDFYRNCIRDAVARVDPLGAVLGPYHPVVRENVDRLRAISGLDAVSFHMSGTEAVMQAVRLARYHTRRRRLVRFCGAYHGWWGDVQPGIGNPLPAPATWTLRDMDARSLTVLRHSRDVACVLVNPLQALHPNASAPADSALVDSSRAAHVDRAAYSAWLRQLREVCDERGIVLIVDEVFTGFRLAAGGAQEYFGVRADMVTYGKTLGGGLPVGVLCGRRSLMRRFRPERPVDICFARGTFNAHPYVMAAMAGFLAHLESPAGQALYRDLDARWNARARRLNDKLAEAGVPVRIANLSTIWTVCFSQPSRYNWMLQYYLRAEGLALSWVGSGRLIFSLNYTDTDFDAVCAAFLRAAIAMNDDGWWWRGPMLSDKAIRRRILREIVTHRRHPRAPSTVSAQAFHGVDELPPQEM